MKKDKNVIDCFPCHLHSQENHPVVVKPWSVKGSNLINGLRLWIMIQNFLPSYKILWSVYFLTQKVDIFIHMFAFAIVWDRFVGTKKNYSVMVLWVFFFFFFFFGGGGGGGGGGRQPLV